MSKWFDIRIQTEMENRNAVRNKIMGWPNEVAQEVYWPELQKIGRSAVAFQRDILLRSTTRTGEERAQHGGRPGRYKTGDMYKAIRMRANKRANNAFTLFVGWQDGKPGYAIFQEHGTKNGVEAMDSVQQTKEFILSQLQVLSRSGRVTAADTTFQGGED